MKSFLKGLGLAVFAAFSAFFFSCDVGETVDVMAPIVSITYPPASSIIREKFCLYGSWTDDKGVMLIQVTVRNTDTGKTVYSGNASVGSGNWNVTLNTPDENGKYPFPDGKYTVDVVAMDTSKRISSTSSRGFEIDNTPPVFVIKNPGSKDIETPSSYGSIFKMNGSIAEAHSVKTFKVTVYDPDSTDADGNPMQLAEWTMMNQKQMNFIIIMPEFTQNLTQAETRAITVLYFFLTMQEFTALLEMIHLIPTKEMLQQHCGLTIQSMVQMPVLTIF